MIKHEMSTLSLAHAMETEGGGGFRPSTSRTQGTLSTIERTAV
jgi:hypothetical protein